MYKYYIIIFYKKRQKTLRIYNTYISNQKFNSVGISVLRDTTKIVKFFYKFPKTNERIGKKNNWQGL